MELEITLAIEEEISITADVEVTVIEGEDAIVRNTDSTYNVSVTSGGTLILSDIIYNVYVNAMFNATSTLPAAVNNTVNIS